MDAARDVDSLSHAPVDERGWMVSGVRKDGVAVHRRTSFVLGAGGPTAQLAIPISVTITYVDYAPSRGVATRETRDLLVARYALPGLFAPVPLGDGHRHVVGGVLCGVPLYKSQPTTPNPKTSSSASTAVPPLSPVAAHGYTCALPPRPGAPAFVAPVEHSRAGPDVMLRTSPSCAPHGLGCSVWRRIIPPSPACIAAFEHDHQLSPVCLLHDCTSTARSALAA